MAICTSHNISFVCGWSILIKFIYLTDTLTLTDKNTAKYVLSFSRNFSFLRGLFLCRTL